MIIQIKDTKFLKYNTILYMVKTIYAFYADESEGRDLGSFIKFK